MTSLLSILGAMYWDASPNKLDLFSTEVDTDLQPCEHMLKIRSDSKDYTFIAHTVFEMKVGFKYKY